MYLIQVNLQGMRYAHISSFGKISVTSTIHVFRLLVLVMHLNMPLLLLLFICCWWSDAVSTWMSCITDQILTSMTFSVITRSHLLMFSTL